MNEQVIFTAALDRPPGERSTYLDEACGEDDKLRRRVEHLLRLHDQAGSFMARPVMESDATIDQPFAEQPGAQVGPYKLLQQIGEGGMGVVYMAEQTAPVERRVALKVIKPGMDTRQVIRRFEAERHALAMMDHPNIAKVLDAGTTETGRPYFVMELVHGVPITQYCDERQLTPRERLELFVPLCQAVQHAHQKGILHRDIKPSNVLVALYDDRAVPKIIDFGLAKAINQRLTERTLFTEFGQVVGTPEYMSPEQAQLNHLDIDTRTDVYSLGVLLYELLAGETPFDRQRLRNAAFDELLRIIREEEPPRPSARLSTSESLPTIAANRHVEPKKLSTLVHGELDWIVMKALDKDRTRRYETASKFAEDVEHYLHDEAVEACPPSRAYRFRKFARRNKAALLTGGTIAAALLVGSAVATWQAVQAVHQRNRAVAAESLAQEEAARADLQAKKAREEAAIARAVNDFLQDDLLQMANPAKQAGSGMTPNPNVTLHTLLDRAAEKIDDRFADQPHIQAEIRFSIGWTYLSIGEYEKAEALFKQNFESRRRTLGEEHPDTLDSLDRLASAYDAQGRYEQAASLHLQALEIQRRGGGDGHRGTLRSLYHLAIIHAQQGRYDEAEKLLRQTLEEWRRTKGEEAGHTLAAMQGLANVCKNQGLYVEAERLARQSLEIRQRTRGKEHPDTLVSALTLASVYNCQDRHEEAETLHSQTLEIFRRTHGGEHPHTLSCMENLAITYLHQGRYKEAETLFRQTLKSWRDTLSDDHPETLRCAGNLARVYIEQGRYEEAERLVRQTLETCRAVLGDDHPSTVSCLSLLSWVLATAAEPAARNPAKAVELARQAVELQPDEYTYCYRLGTALYRHGEFLEAVKTLDKASTMQEREDPEHQIFLAMAYWQTGRHDKALENYEEAVAWLEDSGREGEQRRFQVEAQRLIKPDEITDNAQEEDFKPRVAR